jgi:predicted methyltransferase
MPKFTSAALAFAIIAAPLSAAPGTPQSVSVAAAVASPARTPDNIKMDQSRKPAEVLDFLGLHPGMSVIDLFGGNKYWAEIIAPAVGPKGHVLVWEPKQFFDPDSQKAFADFAAANPNVSIAATPFQAIELPKNSADFVMLNLNYHDTYWQSDKLGIPRMEPPAFLKVVYDAMKPGAVIGVIDHIALPNDDTRATVEKMHRIDPKVARADFERAGFVFAGSSDILRSNADDHSLPVFDPKVRGHTDRFIFKFRKPR